MMVYLTCNTDNKAATVFNSFIGAVDEFGLPSRVRSDKGGENFDVAWYMLNHHKTNFWNKGLNPVPLSKASASHNLQHPVVSTVEDPMINLAK